MFPLLAGLAAGLVHVVSGPDHLAAVAPLAADPDRPQWRAGFQWGLGHTAGVLVVGLLLIWLRPLLPIDAISIYSERIVGVVLVCIGAWGVARARWPQRHVHASPSASFAMGTLHGLAGSSHLFGVVPALALPTQAAALWYLGGFGVGAVVAMTAFAALVGAVALRTARRGLNAYRGMLYACSVCAFLVGGFWLVA
ncbi:MAG: High-affinity nickel transporter [Acidobacteria bacterium]|nr:High-affinity nickel transporter [Acidobacteriota bacterium]